MSKRPNPAPSFLQQLALQFDLPLFKPHTAPEVTAPPSDALQKRRLIQLDAQILDYALRRSRRKSIGFVIDEMGLVITAPRWVAQAQIDAAILEKQKWIIAKIAEMRARRRVVPEVQWQDGGTLPYLNQTITLRIEPGTRQLHFDANARVLQLPAAATTQQVRDRAQAWLQGEARRIFAERLDVFADRLGVRYRQFRLSSAKTRWGSCSADGRILLNWRLVHFPMSSIDYVVAHELAHLKEMNHGPRFWQTVADVLPRFEIERDYLKNPPPELLPKF